MKILFLINNKVIIFIFYFFFFLKKKNLEKIKFKKIQKELKSKNFFKKKIY